MKKYCFALTLATLYLVFSAATPLAGKDYTRYVNPFVGTDFHGHTYPGAAFPFGMVQPGPDTRGADWDGCSGYHWSDSTILGFSHTHLSGTGCADYCDVMLMPVCDLDSIAADCSSTFSHSLEKASPGYYFVHLDRWRTDVELTTSERCAMHRYSYPVGVEPQIVLDLDHRDYCIESSISRMGRSAIGGFRRSSSWAKDQRVYFYMSFSRDIKEIDTTGSGRRALIHFHKKNDNRMTVKVALSSVSVENARANLYSDPFAMDFDLMKRHASNEWNRYLSKIEVDGSREQIRTFYTALYHTALSPNILSDSNGEYRGMDMQVHKAPFRRYTVFSLWDTFRSLHPLLSLIERERTSDFINSFISIYEEGGKLPRWELWGNETDCMIGYNSAPVIADAMASGIHSFDHDKVLDALVATSTLPEFGIDVYRRSGLVLGEEEHESVSKTLEYAFDDWCIAQVARMSRPYVTDCTRCDSIYETYMRRALYYRNQFDPSTGFMRPRFDGMWLDSFNPKEVNVHYTEANSWQYSFHVQQDVSGLVSLLGGEEAFERRLDSLFTTSSRTSGRTQADMTGMIGQYVQGNEPSHHIAYLYSYIGKPWKSQSMARRICDELFSSAPDGLCGNEDCGQMSAWYVFSSLGFYPVTPGSGVYVLGSPLFRKAVIHLEDGTDFTINAPQSNNDCKYIASATLDGRPYYKTYITADDILAGRTLSLELSSTPNRYYGLAPSERPVSRIASNIVENPWFIAQGRTFEDELVFRIGALKDSYRIYYRIVDDSTSYALYTGPVRITDDCTVEAYCEDASGERSFVTKTSFKKIRSLYEVTVLHPYNSQYNAGGNKGLTDGIRGKADFRLGRWQGYQGCDFEAVLDMGSVKPVSRLAAGFLQDTRSWIIMPRWVEFYTSVDGISFTLEGRVEHGIDAQDYTVRICDLSLELAQPVSARYVKVVALNYGTLPFWHQGAGGEAFIFVDEVMID